MSVEEQDFRIGEDELAGSIERNYPRLLNFARKLSRRNEDRAEDLAQTTALKAFRFRDRYVPDGDTDTRVMNWMGTIMRRTDIDMHRRDQTAARSELPIEALEPFVAEAALRDYTPHPAEQLETEEWFAQFGPAIAECIALLSDKQRTIFTLEIQDGMSNAEIAEHLKMPLGSVKSSLRLAKEHLRKALEERGITAAAVFA